MANLKLTSNNQLALLNDFKLKKSCENLFVFFLNRVYFKGKIKGKIKIKYIQRMKNFAAYGTIGHRVFEQELSELFLLFFLDYRRN